MFGNLQIFFGGIYHIFWGIYHISTLNVVLDQSMLWSSVDSPVNIIVDLASSI